MDGEDSGVSGVDGEDSGVFSVNGEDNGVSVWMAKIVGFQCG